MLLECSCPACHLPPAGGTVLQVGPAGPAHDVAAVALVDLLPRPELVVAHLQQGLAMNSNYCCIIVKSYRTLRSLSIAVVGLVLVLVQQQKPGDVIKIL